MSEVENILGIGLGGTSIMGLIAYLLYSWSKGNCASHLKVGDTEINLDMNTMKEVKEVLSSVDEKEREKIKNEIKKDMQNTLHRVKSRLKNALTETRVRRDAMSETV